MSRFSQVMLLLFGSFLVQCGDAAVDPGNGDAGAADPSCCTASALAPVVIVDGPVPMVALDARTCASPEFDTKGLRRIVAHHSSCARPEFGGGSAFQWKQGAAGFASQGGVVCQTGSPYAEAYVTELDGHRGRIFRYVESYSSNVSCPEIKFTIFGYAE
jgi:hypothetical protein